MKNNNTKSKVKSRKINFKKVLKSIILTLTLFTICFTAVSSSSASTRYFKAEMYTGNIVYYNEYSKTPNLSKYPWNKKSINSISFSDLYGVRKNLITYYGEVPYANDGDEFVDGYHMYPSNQIDGKIRPYSDAKITEDDFNNNSETDLHLKAMTRNHNLSGAGNALSFIGINLTNGINFIASEFVNLIITIRSLKLSSILDLLDSDGTLTEKLTKVFLFDRSTSTMSPFLILGLVVFMISFAMLAFQTLKGNKSFRIVLQELGLFCLAAIVAAIFLTPTNTTKLSNVGTSILDSLATKTITSSSDSTDIYSYQTGNESIDAINTQKALIDKIYIDQLIKAQFGYSVNDLYITTRDGTSGGFGDSDKIETALKKTFGDDYIGIDQFSVITDTSCQKSINNLGYYFFAANSQVKIKNSLNAGNPFIPGGNGSNYISASTDRVLYVIDFLNNLRAEYKDNDSAMVNKIDTILQHFMKPNYSGAIGSILLVTVQNVVMAIALAIIGIFTLLGQIIVIFGSFCMIVMPILLLIKQTRRIAKQMIFTYLFAFLRYVIGSALFNIVIVICVLFCMNGIPGIIFSIIVSLILAKFGPNLLRIINEYMSRMSGGKELAFMSNVNRKFNDRMRKMGYQPGNSRRFGGESGRFSGGKTGHEAQEGMNKNERRKPWQIGRGKKNRDYHEDLAKRYDSQQSADTIGDEEFLDDENQETMRQIDNLQVRVDNGEFAGNLTEDEIDSNDPNRPEDQNIHDQDDKDSKHDQSEKNKDDGNRKTTIPYLLDDDGNPILDENGQPILDESKIDAQTGINTSDEYQKQLIDENGQPILDEKENPILENGDTPTTDISITYQKNPDEIKVDNQPSDSKDDLKSDGKDKKPKSEDQLVEQKLSEEQQKQKEYIESLRKGGLNGGTVLDQSETKDLIESAKDITGTDMSKKTSEGDSQVVNGESLVDSEIIKKKTVEERVQEIAQQQIKEVEADSNQSNIPKEKGRINTRINGKPINSHEENSTKQQDIEVKETSSIKPTTKTTTTTKQKNSDQVKPVVTEPIIVGEEKVPRKETKVEYKPIPTKRSNIDSSKVENAREQKVEEKKTSNQSKVTEIVQPVSQKEQRQQPKQSREQKPVQQPVQPKQSQLQQQKPISQKESVKQKKETNWLGKEVVTDRESKDYKMSTMSSETASKADEQKKKERKQNAKKTGKLILTSIPGVGGIAGKAISKKEERFKNDKDRLQKEMIDIASKSMGKITINEAREQAIANLMQGTRNSDRDAREKILKNVASSFTVEDMGVIKRDVNKNIQKTLENEKLKVSSDLAKQTSSILKQNESKAEKLKRMQGHNSDQN